MNSRNTIMVSFRYRKIFPFCVDQIKKTSFLYFSSLNGLGDQIRTGDLAVPNRARYQLRHTQICLSYHENTRLSQLCYNIKRYE